MLLQVAMTTISLYFIAVVDSCCLYVEGSILTTMKEATLEVSPLIIKHLLVYYYSSLGKSNQLKHKLIALSH